MLKYFTLFGAQFPVYNLLVGYSIYLGIKLSSLQVESLSNSNFIKKHKEYVLIALIIGGFFSASLFEDLYHLEFLTLGRNGITFYGGLLFGLCTVFILSRIYSFDCLNLFNCYVPALMLAHSVGRIACFLAGCCYGQECLGIICFKDDAGISRFPIQLVEALLNFIGYYLTMNKIKFSWRFYFYLLFYPLIRFFIEMLRDDDRGGLFQNYFTPSQLVSIFLFSLGLLLLFKKVKSENIIRYDI